MDGFNVEGTRAHAASAGASGQRTGTSSSALRKTTAFRFHANESGHPRDHDDKYRTLTLCADGTFTDYNEHLWDLKSEWITEGVNCVVYGGTYTLDPPQILGGSRVDLHYSKVVSRVTDVVTAKESLAADEPLTDPVIISGTLDAGGRSLTVKQYRQVAYGTVEQYGQEAEPQTLVAGKKHPLGSGACGKYG